MSWNYRIVKYRDNSGFGIHEVYYDDEGKPWGMTSDPGDFCCGLEEGKEGIVSSLCHAMIDVLRTPVLIEPEEGNWPGKSI